MQSARAGLRLDDALFSYAAAARIVGVTQFRLRRWVTRGTVPRPANPNRWPGLFSLEQVIQIAALADLADNARVSSGTAAQVASVAAREIARFMPGGCADVDAVPRTLALVVSWPDAKTEEPSIGLLDPAASGYAGTWRTDYGKAHISVPLAALLARVLWAASNELAAAP